MSKCEYYPCHDVEDYDCRLCYCPFYELCQRMPDSFIEYYNLGGYWLDRSRHGLPRVWACEKCNMNHDKEVADFYEIHKESRSVDWLYAMCATLWREKTVVNRRIS